MANATAPVRYMQGIAVPAESVRPQEFFARTRRHVTTERNAGYAGLGGQDMIEIKKSDILSEITVRFTGSLVVTPGTGTVGSTAAWPYNLLKNIRFTANGQSNLVSVSGLALKAREYMAKGDRSDRGIAQTIGGSTKSQGTLALACEAWGVGSNTSSLSGGTYPVELQWTVPVAEDQVDLAGAIFCATSSTDLTLTVDWAQANDLFALTGNAGITLTGSLQVISTKFSVPMGSSGEIVVPDLSLFHSLIQSRTTSIANGPNEVRLAGQGAGKRLLRIMYQVYNGSGNAAAPLQMNATNFGKQAWRYAGNETPDEYIDGQHLRIVNERQTNVDLGGIWGYGVHEFASENAFRDTVDEGTTSELRLYSEIQSGVSLTSPALVYVAETIFSAGSGA